MIRLTTKAMRGPGHNSEYLVAGPTTVSSPGEPKKEGKTWVLDTVFSQIDYRSQRGLVLNAFGFLLPTHLFIQNVPVCPSMPGTWPGSVSARMSQAGMPCVCRIQRRTLPLNSYTDKDLAKCPCIHSVRLSPIGPVYIQQDRRAGSRGDVQPSENQTMDLK